MTVYIKYWAWFTWTYTLTELSKRIARRRISLEFWLILLCFDLVPLIADKIASNCCWNASKLKHTDKKNDNKKPLMKKYVPDIQKLQNNP